MKKAFFVIILLFLLCSCANDTLSSNIISPKDLTAEQEELLDLIGIRDPAFFEFAFGLDINSIRYKVECYSNNKESVVLWDVVEDVSLLKEGEKELIKGQLSIMLDPSISLFVMKSAFQRDNGQLGFSNSSILPADFSELIAVSRAQLQKDVEIIPNTEIPLVVIEFHQKDKASGYQVNIASQIIDNIDNMHTIGDWDKLVLVTVSFNT